MKLRSLLPKITGAILAAGFGAATAAELPYNLKPGKPYAGTQLNILSVVTPQFDGLMLRDGEFTGLTGIETRWTSFPSPRSRKRSLRWASPPTAASTS